MCYAAEDLADRPMNIHHLKIVACQGASPRERASGRQNTAGFAGGVFSRKFLPPSAAVVLRPRDPAASRPNIVPSTDAAVFLVCSVAPDGIALNFYGIERHSLCFILKFEFALKCISLVEKGRAAFTGHNPLEADQRTALRVGPLNVFRCHSAALCTIPSLSLRAGIDWGGALEDKSVPILKKSIIGTTRRLTLRSSPGARRAPLFTSCQALDDLYRQTVDS